MIAMIRGTVVSLGADHAVVDIGPLAVQVTCALPLLIRTSVGDRVHWWTALVVREDAWTLYGFDEISQKAMFELVQTVTGIGPRIALALLSAMSVEHLTSAIATENLTTLIKAPGLGRKGAQRLVLELKDKVVAVSGEAESASLEMGNWRQAVTAGLMSLGWSQREAEQACEAISEQAGPEPDVGALLNAALQTLDRA